MGTPVDRNTASSSSVNFYEKRTVMQRLTDSLKQESSFLNVPFIRFKKLVRDNHSVVMDEINDVISEVTKAADDRELCLDDSVKLLESLASRMKKLRQLSEDGSSNEELQSKRIMSRLGHLGGVNLTTYPYWKTLRMSRILVDYLLRMSYRDTALKLAEETDIQNIIDIEEFDEARGVISALQRKDVAPALAWCADNKDELKKSESKLELDLRLQEFIELVRAEDKLQALAYAQKYLAPWGTTHMKDLGRVMATLVFGSNTQCAIDKVLFEANRWDCLVDQFKQEFFKLYGMTDKPLLYIYLQAGLCALKTPFCYKDDCNKEDPLSQESLRDLASSLPFSMPSSKLVCYITRELMGPGNLPVLLPNGYIYSYNAVRDMYYQNDGKVTCPRTGSVYKWEELVHLLIYR